MNEERKKETPRGLTYSYLLFCRMQQVQHNTHTYTKWAKEEWGEEERRESGGPSVVK